MLKLRIKPILDKGHVFNILQSSDKAAIAIYCRSIASLGISSLVITVKKTWRKLTPITRMTGEVFSPTQVPEPTPQLLSLRTCKDNFSCDKSLHLTLTTPACIAMPLWPSSSSSCSPDSRWSTVGSAPPSTSRISPTRRKKHSPTNLASMRSPSLPNPARRASSSFGQ